MSKPLCPECGKQPAQVNTNGSMSTTDWEIAPCRHCTASAKLIEYGVYRHHSKASMKDFDKEFDSLFGDSVFLYGPPGAGKTHLAVALMRADIILGNKAAFVTAANMLAEIKATFERDSEHTESQLVGYYSNVRNLFLDDIGVERPTDWALQTLYTIIDKRYGNELRTVITSNLNIDELSIHLGARLVSRIVGMCEVIEVKGKDRRIPN